jgi:excisionase family DNA binding protein
MTSSNPRREANLSLVQAAARLGVSPYTLRGWAKYGRRLPYLRLGRRLLFRPEDLEAFERRCFVAAAEGGEQTDGRAKRRPGGGTRMTMA